MNKHATQLIALLTIFSLLNNQQIYAETKGERTVYATVAEIIKVKEYCKKNSLTQKKYKQKRNLGQEKNQSWNDFFENENDPTQHNDQEFKYLVSGLSSSQIPLAARIKYGAQKGLSATLVTAKKRATYRPNSRKFGFIFDTTKVVGTHPGNMWRNYAIKSKKKEFAFEEIKRKFPVKSVENILKNTDENHFNEIVVSGDLTVRGLYIISDHKGEPIPHYLPKEDLKRLKIFCKKNKVPLIGLNLPPSQSLINLGASSNNKALIQYALSQESTQQYINHIHYVQNPGKYRLEVANTVYPPLYHALRKNNYSLVKELITKYNANLDFKIKVRDTQSESGLKTVTLRDFFLNSRRSPEIIKLLRSSHTRNVRQSHCEERCGLECPEYLKKNLESCENYKRYACIKYKYRQMNGASIDQGPYFQAIRLVSRDHLAKAIKSQRDNKAEFLNPKIIYSPPQTWDLWMNGHAVLDRMVRDDQKSRKFEFSTKKLKAIHKVVIDKEIGGSVYKIPVINRFVAPPGKTKRGIPRITTGFPIKNYGTTQEIVERGNLPMLYEPKQKYMKIIANRLTFPSTQYMDKELELIFKRSNQQLASLIKLEDGPTDIDPLDIIAETQKRLTMLHAFHEGAGRSSRFYQDYVTKSLCLPPVPAGYLQEDLHSSLDEYQKDTQAAVKTMLDEMEKCLAPNQTDEVRFKCHPGPEGGELNENTHLTECSKGKGLSPFSLEQEWEQFVVEIGKFSESDESSENIESSESQSRSPNNSNSNYIK